MCNGSFKAIAELEDGDWVLARDPETGEVECRQAIDPYANPERVIVELELVDEDGVAEVIETTNNHPFWVDGKGWTRVDQLRTGGPGAQR